MEGHWEMFVKVRPGEVSGCVEAPQNVQQMSLWAGIVDTASLLVASWRRNVPVRFLLNPYC